MGRRAVLIATLACAAALVTPQFTLADDDISVPIPLQIELLLKVASYDKNLPQRAPTLVKVLLLTKTGNAQSSRIGQAAARALEGKSAGNRPVEASLHEFVSAPVLASKIKEAKVAIVYVAPGFDNAELDAIAKALAGLSVLSAGAVTRFIDSGVVLGFELVSGKPKLVVHLRRARAQSVDLSSQVLKIVRVIE